MDWPFFSAIFCIKDRNRAVSVKPGKILFTVIPNLPTSAARVFAQLATAPRIVFETPKSGIGCLTEVEIILIIRP